VGDLDKYYLEKWHLSECFGFFSGYLDKRCPRKLLRVLYRIESNVSRPGEDISVSNFIILAGYSLGCLSEFSRYTRRAKSIR
jgi:hypothetical protein